MYNRVLAIEDVLKRKSVFIFGPRQTGKSTWLKAVYKDALYINLLSQKVCDAYINNTDLLFSDIQLFLRKSKSKIIIIDEVQKIPQLLDEVHKIIEEDKSLRFILTGSSSRKLKRTAANLLGGRASLRSMFPLVFKEIRHKIKTAEALLERISSGGLPSIYDSKNPSEDLQDYIQLYLNEEIRNEGLVRSYENFHRFLQVSALTNAKQVNFTQIGSDAQVPARTIHDYFQILEDTLIGFMLPAFTKTPTRKAVTASKFYLFDTGVVNGLLKRENVSVGTTEFGDLFEHYIISEVRAYLSYTNSQFEMFYWRSASQFEVDLILQKNKQIYAIEIKGKSNFSEKDIKGIKAFCEDYPQAQKILITWNAKRAIRKDKLEIYSALDFLNELWDGEFLKYK